MPIKLQIGELARERGLTIKALAERAGVAYNTAHALYTSRATRIDLDTLDRMCDALQVKPGDIFVRYTVQEHSGYQPQPVEDYGSDLDRATRQGEQQVSHPQ
ncbi:MAG TPA: helix-turn-helix transcriptional regulator [Herpetosiphonaceae bacterium]